MARDMAIGTPDMNDLYGPIDFWSDPVEEVEITDSATDVSLPDVTVSDLPNGATVVKSTVMLMADTKTEDSASDNQLDGATVAATSQVIQVRDDTPGSWADCINFVDDQLDVPASTREGGPIFIGSVDVSSTIDGNDTYNFQWKQALADGDGIQLRGVKVGIRIWYSK